jgi:hypothetical protein
MAKDPTQVLAGGRLACGCQLAFRAGVAGSPVTVVIERKADGCTMAIHVGGLAVFDHREALRPATRFLPHTHSDHEEEG